MLMADFILSATTINFDGLSSLWLRNVTTYVLATAGAKIAKKRGESKGVGSSMIILDRTAKATDNIRLKPGGHRVSQHKIQIALPKMRQLWMRKPRSGKTGFVAWHHDKGYDWKRAGNEIRWLWIMVSTAL